MNNKYMGIRFDPRKESHYLMYLDVNNLCSHAMSQSLPTGGFKWVKDLNNLRGHISKLACRKRSKGYLLEVDISYCSNFQDLHNDLPFMCEKMETHGRGPKAGSQYVQQEEIHDSHRGS